MPTASNPELARDFAAALDWWREAGVDCDFVDEPRSWLAAPSKDAAAIREAPSIGEKGLPANEVEALGSRDSTAPSSSPANDPGQRRRPPDLSPSSPAFAPEEMPSELDAFREWWMREPALDAGRTSQRVPPRGESGADLMILVPEPESVDRDRLLSGAQGKVLEGFLDAAQIDPATVYHASFFPRHSPGADWRGAEAAAIAPAVLRHIKLARPKRVIVLGFNVLPLLGNELPQGPASLANLKHEGVTIPLLAARALDGMDRRPSWKAALWQTWLDWHRA